MIVPNNYPGWSPAGMLVALILGVGFWFGMIKRSFKIKTDVDRDRAMVVTSAAERAPGRVSAPRSSPR